MDTPLHFFGDRRITPAEEEALYGLNAIPRVLQSIEIASVVLFFAGDEATYCTGAAFVADGGRLARSIRRSDHLAILDAAHRVAPNECPQTPTLTRPRPPA